MKDYLANDIRNVVLLGQSGAGKSSLVEASLLYTKAINRLGKAQDGTSTVDFDPEEVKRGQSVFTAIAPVEWKNCKINFIDTPGYLDYAGEKTAGFAVGDNALVVVSAKEGVETGTLNAMKMLKKRNLPTIFFINKMDDENASFEKTYEQLREQFGTQIIPFEYPIVENHKMVGSINILNGKAWYYNDLSTPKEVPENLKGVVEEYYNQIAEAIASSDDELIEKFFEGEQFTDAEVARGLRIGVRSGEIKPCFCGSALEGKGVERILDLITEYFPCYAEKGMISALDEKGAETLMETNENEKFSAQVYKTIVDPFVGKISYIKVMSGVLSSDSQIWNANKNQAEKLGVVYIIKGKNQIAVGKLFTGDLGAIVKLPYAETNDTLCTKEKKVTYPEIDFPEPMLGVAVAPKTKADEDKMSEALKRILDEDKTLKFVKNGETGEQVLYTVGDQQLDVVCNRLKTKYKVEITTKTPKVQYRETITAKVEKQGKHKKQTGGAGQYGDVWVRFEPNPESEEMVFETDIFGGSVPRQFWPPTEQGLRECMEHGILAGYKVVGVKATLFDGSIHPVDSKEVAFKAAARLAFKAAMPEAKPILLEPIGKVTIYAPDQYTGAIMGDLSKRNGVVLGMEMTEDGEQRIEGEVPMAEMQKYATELRAMTQGTGTYLIEFDRYQRASKEVTDKVIAQAAKEKKDEEE